MAYSIQLTITAAEVGGLARLDIVDDSVAAADVAFVLTNEQAAWELHLDPTVFALGVTELLRRNVAKLLAAEVIDMRRRQVGAAGDLQLGTGSSEIKLTRAPDSGAILRAAAFAELAPYWRKQELVIGAQSSLSAGAMAGTSLDDQDVLFGPTEIERGAGLGANIDADNNALYDPDTGRW